MELIQVVMDLVLPPVLLMFMLIILPPYLIYKFLNTILKRFTVENLTGKVVLVTGASSGIGEQLAYAYAKKGARLALVDIREDRLPRVAETARKFGSPDTINIYADVSKSNNCNRFVEETVNHFGHLDHLVNNAGIVSGFYFEESTDISNTSSVMDTNFWGSVYATQFALPHLKKSKGKILVIGSASTWLYGPYISIYGASKAALENFYETLGVELGSSVKITIASPGLVESEITQGKHLNVDGVVQVDKGKIDALIGFYPVRSSSACAKALVNAVCRGDKHVTFPNWIRFVYVYKLFFPEIIEWIARSVFVIIPNTPRKNAAATNNISHTNGIKKSS